MKNSIWKKVGKQHGTNPSGWAGVASTDSRMESVGLIDVKTELTGKHIF